jgi:hypothetical protein
MDLMNLSSQPEGVLRSWLPHGLRAERVIFLPDACPGKSPLPTGTVVFTRQPDWRRFAVSDCGCGMRLLRSSLRQEDLTQPLWDEVALALRRNKGSLGDLGGGNHFCDVLLPYDEDSLHVLIHTGSRLESGIVDDLVDDPISFDREFWRVVEWARSNRQRVQETLEAILGQMELILDLPHNAYEEIKDGVIIRKGSVRLEPGELSILPSHVSGDVALIRAKDRIADILCSMSHGTGRKVSRGDAKRLAVDFDFHRLRKAVMMPSCLEDASLAAEGPYAYRDLDECLCSICDYVEEIGRYSIIAYAGHL